MVKLTLQDCEDLLNWFILKSSKQEYWQGKERNTLSRVMDEIS